MTAEATVPQREAESGFSLIELLVYMVLSIIVLMIVGGFLINSLKTSNTVRDTTQSTTAAQLIATSVQTGVRNASAVKVTDESGGSQLVLARTASRGASFSWVCQAWYYSAADHAVYTTTTDPAVAITVPTGSPGGSWTLLSTGVNPANGTSPVFGGSSASISLAFSVSLGGQPAAQINTDAYMRTDTPESAPCF